MKLAWLTDIHLNFIPKEARCDFYQSILNTEPDAILLTGDIAEAPSLVDILKEMADFLQKPIYFVLGNHDYYRGQIKEIRKAMAALTQSSHLLFWLPATKIQSLADGVLLIGQDGWADGRFGDFENSKILLNDNRMIAELFQEKLLSESHLLKKMQHLADADAAHLQAQLIQAVEQKPKKIIVLTHVPPFKEICLPRENANRNDWLPYFSSQAMGQVLLEAAERNSTIEFLVLCGHTHIAAQYRPLDNLRVEAGTSEYYKPGIQAIIQL